MGLVMVLIPREGRETTVLLDFAPGDPVAVRYAAQYNSHGGLFAYEDGKREAMEKDTPGTVHHIFEGDVAALLVDPSRHPKRIQVRVNGRTVVDLPYQDALDMAKLVRF